MMSGSGYPDWLIEAMSCRPVNTWHVKNRPSSRFFSHSSRPNKSNESLNHAVRTQQIDVVKKLLADPKIDVKRKTAEGLTVVHYAAFTGNVDIMRLLMGDRRCQKLVNACDRNDRTPLHYALISENVMSYPEITRILVANQANINLADNKCETPLAACLHNARHHCDGPVEEDTERWQEQEQQQLIETVSILCSTGKLIFSASCGYFSLAVQAGSVECARLLVRSGAPVTLDDSMFECLNECRLFAQVIELLATEFDLTRTDTHIYLTVISRLLIVYAKMSVRGTTHLTKPATRNLAAIIRAGCHISDRDAAFMWRNCRLPITHHISTFLHRLTPLTPRTSHSPHSPHSLQSQCRISIRRLLKNDLHHKLDSIPQPATLPRRLVRYVLMEEELRELVDGPIT